MAVQPCLRLGVLTPCTGPALLRVAVTKLGGATGEQTPRTYLLPMCGRHAARATTVVPVAQISPIGV